MNQIEKVNWFGEFGIGKKPAEKFLFDEVSVLFCEGSHGEFEMLKDVSWENEGGGFVRKNKRRKKIERCMILCLFGR